MKKSLLLCRTLLIFCGVFLPSCLDMFLDKPQNIVGNIYLWNSSGSDEKFLMLKTGKSSFAPIFSEVVVVALANDSIIYVKSQTHEHFSFYSIRHKNGFSILDVKKIDSTLYEFLTHKKFPYTYSLK